jgi:hypothetical protein
MEDVLDLESDALKSKLRFKILGKLFSFLIYNTASSTHILQISSQN